MTWDIILSISNITKKGGPVQKAYTNVKSREGSQVHSLNYVNAYWIGISGTRTCNHHVSERNDLTIAPRLRHYKSQIPTSKGNNNHTLFINSVFQTTIRSILQSNGRQWVSWFHKFNLSNNQTQLSCKTKLTSVFSNVSKNHLFWCENNDKKED